MTESTLLPVVMLALLLAWPAFALVMAAVAAFPQPLPEPAGRGRNYWIIIAALNEDKVIRATVEAALALHSEQAPVRVMVVDDGSDDETPQVLRELAHERLHVIRREYPQARQGKGEALNAGYRAIRDLCVAEFGVDTTVVGVIDGDGRATPDTIRDVVDAYFADPRVGAVQCRVRISNRGRLLGLLQDIEFCCVANASQCFRDLVDTVGMGGNGQFVRLRDLMRYRDTPWSSCLVEDLELGLRLHLDGVRIRYSSVAVIHQQAIVEIGPLVRQRARWAQGNLQCARYLGRLSRSRQVGSIGLLDYLAYLVTPWLTVPVTLLFLGIVGIVLGGLLTGSSLGGLIATGSAVPAAIGLWIAVIFFPGLMWGVWHRSALADEPSWRCLLAGVCYPFFLAIGVVATWRGLARHLAGRNSWAKTDRVDEAWVDEARADEARVDEALPRRGAVSVPASGPAVARPTGPPAGRRRR